MNKLRFETPAIPPARKPMPGDPRACPDSGAGACAHPGCTAEGVYPAPRSRADLRDYIFLCLDHVRAYNRDWNYFAGCDADDMERAIRDSVTWERPSWKFSNGHPAYGTGEAPHRFDDVFGVFGDTASRARNGGEGHGHGTGQNGGNAPCDETAKAWEVFGLAPGQDPACDMLKVKKRYKELAKRHHPDANGGSRKAEDKLKTINRAYSVLKAGLETAP